MPPNESDASDSDSGFPPSVPNAESTDSPIIPDSPDALGPYHRRNFLSLVFYQMTVRCGWIFKTESIVMPAVLDLIGGGAVLRSWLPLIYRCGQSIPPLLLAPQVRSLRQKKWCTFGCTIMMSLIFFLLAWIWGQTGGVASWVPVVFLLLYALFFSCTGLNHLAINTLQGKLIRVRARGRLMMSANVLGGFTALILAGLLLPRWLNAETAEFEWIFAASACFFGLAAIFLLFMRESADDYPRQKTTIGSLLKDVAKTLREDRHFRGLAVVAFLFGCSMMLFPHYQNVGRGILKLNLKNLVLWVMVQNAGTALFSLLVGPLADRRGYRSVLRVVLLPIVIAPLLVMVFSQLPSLGEQLYWLVFLMVGLTPVLIKTFQNYTLELAPHSEHPRYLATISLCIAAPMVFSPLLGLLIQWCQAAAWCPDDLAFHPAFAVVMLLIFYGWVKTFYLYEPRVGNASVS